MKFILQTNHNIFSISKANRSSILIFHFKFILKFDFSIWNSYFPSKLIFFRSDFFPSEKSIWSFYFPSKNDFLFCNFAKNWKSIWISYLLSKLMLFRQGRNMAANFTQTLWNVRLWEASLGHKSAPCGPRVSKRPPQPLCLIRVSRSSQHRGSHAEKVPIWTTNSCSILIFTFSKKRKIKNQFSKANRSSILIFDLNKIFCAKKSILDHK